MPARLRSGGEHGTQRAGGEGGDVRGWLCPCLTNSSPPAVGNQRHQQAEEWGTPACRADPETGVQWSSSGAGMGQPLFSFQAKLGPSLCPPLPAHTQEGPPALPAWRRGVQRQC